MEKMLGEKMLPPVNLKQFLSEYKNKIFNVNNFDIKKAMQELKAKDLNFKETEKNCSIEQIQHKDDTRISTYLPGYSENNRVNVTMKPDKTTKMKTVETLLKFKGSSQLNPFTRSTDSFKSVQLPSSEYATKLCEAYNDLIVNIRVYRPARATHVGQSLEKPVFAEEFECLGSNFLTELRDKISCVCKDKRFFDISENPDSDNFLKTTDPGFFFITDTFYNDHRNSGNIDYSETIRNWAKTARGLSDLVFKVAEMKNTRFLDLSVSLGFPQLYQHHGNCEHVFVFSQVEVLTPSTLCPYREQYPRVKSYGLYNNRLCHTCGKNYYNFIVEDSNRLPHNPAYVCYKCFYDYFYIDKKKIGNFKAYRISDFVTKTNEPI